MLNLNKGNNVLKTLWYLVGHNVLNYAVMSAMHISHIFNKRPSLVLN